MESGGFNAWVNGGLETAVLVLVLVLVVDDFVTLRA